MNHLNLTRKGLFAVGDNEHRQAWLKLDIFNFLYFMRKNTRNMLRHITLVMPENLERLKLEGGKEIEVTERWVLADVWCSGPTRYNRELLQPQVSSPKQIHCETRCVW